MAGFLPLIFSLNADVSLFEQAVLFVVDVASTLASSHDDLRHG